MVRSIGDLTDYELARLILSRLWHLQDVGGVSVGRSVQSTLLEAALKLLPVPEGVNAFSIDERELFCEASRRNDSSIIPPLQQLLFHQLEWYTDEIIVHLLLDKLCRHYQKMADDVAVTDNWSFMIEAPLAAAALNLCQPGDEFDRSMLTVPYRLIVDVADDRFHRRCDQEDLERFGYGLVPPAI